MMMLILCLYRIGYEMEVGGTIGLRTAKMLMAGRKSMANGTIWKNQETMRVLAGMTQRNVMACWNIE